MQKLLIRFVLTPLSALTEKLSEKNRDQLFLLGGLGILIYFFLYNMQVIQWRYLYSFVICSGFLGLMILSQLRRDIQPVRFNRAMTVCWFAVGLLMFQSGVLNNASYLPEAMLFLVAYPVLYVCWANSDTQRIFKLLLKLCRISLAIFLAGSFLIAQITARRYGGFFVNVNNCANYLSLACICLVLELAYEPRFNGACLRNILLFGAAYAIIGYTNSRSGLLSVLCAVAVGAVIFFLARSWEEKKQALIRGLCCALAAVIMSGCLLYVLQLRQLLPIPYYNNKTHAFYFTDYWEAQFEKQQHGGATTPGETVDPDEEFTQPTFFGMESFEDLSEEKNDTTNKTADQFSTGRLSVWKAYLEKLTLFGVEEKEPVYIDILYRSINTTHMTILEIAYESGIFAGVFYFAVNILSGILAIVYAWKKRGEAYSLMPLMVILTFGVDSVLRTNNISFNYMTTFYYYLILFPLMTMGKAGESAVPAPRAESERS